MNHDRKNTSNKLSASQRSELPFEVASCVGINDGGWKKVDPSLAYLDKDRPRFYGTCGELQTVTSRMQYPDQALQRWRKENVWLRPRGSAMRSHHPISRRSFSMPKSSNKRRAPKCRHQLFGLPIRPSRES